MDKNEFEVTRLQEQIQDLKAELVEMSANISSGVDKLERAAKPSIGVIRDNPGTVSTIAVSAGIIGLAVGYLIGTTASASGSRWHL
ncbi:hypothetical protein IHQ71_04450 [Rhizobium sp. TH2]|uniref:hypothetical protein n=1 Tax=Rhizobium sp. TH2 TaxID=2775403 RepID=UPI00215702CF|nr:hypothetical protein [Rhizobium sp. TH2]UVC09870.1 hypothetical protein IHQ71_04450 [Rhizobium sp. TH2]